MQTVTTGGHEPRRESFYAVMIRETMKTLGIIGYDPRWIEGFMRLEHGTLDGLARSAFRHEVQVAIACIDEVGQVASESLAQSYGL